MLKISFIINIILAIALVSVSVFFISGKGINIDKRSISTSISNSYASSGSFAVGYIGGDYRGNWKVKMKIIDSGNLEDNLAEFFNTLSPLQFTLAQVTMMGSKIFVYYPDIATAEDSKTKKIVNGVEVKQ